MTAHMTTSADMTIGPLADGLHDLRQVDADIFRVPPCDGATVGRAPRSFSFESFPEEAAKRVMIDDSRPRKGPSGKDWQARKDW
jgi:hypothetical protein